MSLSVPVKINRHRRKKFTKIKNPYKAYNNAKWNWSDVFKEINHLKTENKKGYIRHISKKYGINYNTLKHKYNKWNDDKIYKIDQENRGGANKIFSNKEEVQLFTHIKKTYIDNYLPLCNEDIKIMALNKFKLKNKQSNFSASDGWCNNFKKRWRLTSVTPKISRKASHICTNKEINNFINQCINSSDDVGENFFLI